MNPPDAELRELLRRTHTVAVVGLSDKPERDSNEVARYLQGQGYRVVPVNPALTEVLGEPSYPSLTSIPSSVSVDLVDIFRRSEEVPAIVDEAVARRVPAVWMQLGISHPGAAARGRAAGLLVVEDQCIRTQHRRLGLGTLGSGT